MNFGQPTISTKFLESWSTRIDSLREKSVPKKVTRLVRILSVVADTYSSPQDFTSSSHITHNASKKLHAYKENRGSEG